MSVTDEMLQNNNPAGDQTAPSVLPKGSNPEIPSFAVVPTSVQNLFRRPALVRGEDRDDINSLAGLLAKLLRPDDVIGWLLGSQFIDSQIEVRRVSRIKAGILNLEYDRLVDQQRDAHDMKHAIKVAGSFGAPPDNGHCGDAVGVGQEGDRTEQADGAEAAGGAATAGAEDAGAEDAGAEDASAGPADGNAVVVGDEASDASPAHAEFIPPPKPRLVIDMDATFTVAYLNRYPYYGKADEFLAIALERRNRDFSALQRHCEAVAAGKITDGGHKGGKLPARSKAA